MKLNKTIQLFYQIKFQLKTLVLLISAVDDFSELGFQDWVCLHVGNLLNKMCFDVTKLTWLYSNCLAFVFPCCFCFTFWIWCARSMGYHNINYCDKLKNGNCKFDSFQQTYLTMDSFNTMIPPSKHEADSKHGFSFLSVKVF